MNNRREFLRQSGEFLSATTVALSFQHLLSSQSLGIGTSSTRGYGPLRPVKDETTGLNLLQLPEGFRYASFGWTGDELADGTKTPGVHDGMAVISAQGDRLILCRNHELKGNGRPFTSAERSYDPTAPGGCTNLVFDGKQGKWLKAFASISGTVKNCAGGPTPWGTWLTCEETIFGPGDDDEGESLHYERDHGWIFEVPAEGVANPQPLKSMGRFVHEAIAIDPKTGIVYETEDSKKAGFYRFLPTTKQKLADGGKLQMLKAKDAPDLRKGSAIGQIYDVEWVDIPNPEQAHSAGKKDEAGVFEQGRKQGGTTFARLEGCWFGSERIYFNSTSGGKAEVGQVWEFHPGEQTLKLIFESPGPEVLEKPDNITVSPRGGIVLCEDGGLKPQRIHGLTPDGQLFTFAANNVELRGERNGFEGDYRDSEWAGATFSPDGQWLFANIQKPGITFAITGPWGEGSL
jgi:secreted PhoX family phosphatase